MVRVQVLRRVPVTIKRSTTLADYMQVKPDSAYTGNSRSWVAYIPIAIVALIGVIVAWHTFNMVSEWEQHRVHLAFRSAAKDRVLMIQREIEQSLGLVQDIGSFFDASDWIGRRDFRKFVGPAILRYSGIVALQWIPRVSETERASFEEKARRSFPRFRITESNQDGELVTAEPRPVHFPVFYVQPYQLNKEALGLDLASDPAHVVVLHEIQEAGQMRASPRISLEREGRIDYGFIARLPVYDKAGTDELEAESGEEETSLEIPEKRQLPLRGFAAGIFRISEIVESALQNLSPSGIDMIISDVSDENERHFLYRHFSRKRFADAEQSNLVDAESQENKVLIQTISVAGRRWEVLCSSISGYFQPDLRSAWVTLAGGLTVTGLLTIYLSTLVGSSAKVKRLVNERTTQLVEMNEALNSEITERLNAEKELQGLNETLEERVAVRTAEAERHVGELEQFAYVASHDLKAPLRGIANLATWLEEDLQEVLTEDTREQLDLLRDRVQRMNALIEGLLEYSRIGKAAHPLENVDTGELLAEVIDSLSPPDEFVVDVAANMPALYTDRLHLYQVFSNLIGNSIKHASGVPGHAGVTVNSQNGYYQFTVTDDGPGIAPEFHDKIFMMFQTLAVNDYGSNTGIGLALVKKIVQEHGGSITVQSKEGNGATFTFTWPVHG
jgi:signal transduction histidine kinase/sensor domain CHASE-containing protein